MKYRHVPSFLLLLLCLTTEAHSQITRLQSIRICNEFSGSDAGARIAACIADLPSSGGTADARGFEGSQTITRDPFSGVTKPVMLMLGAATFTQSVAVTVPTNVTIGFSQGSIFSLNSGTTFSLSGEVVAPRSQIFAGTGTVDFPVGGRTSELNPEWWGAKADGSTDSTAAITEAATASVGTSATRSTPIRFGCGTYLVTGITLTDKLPNLIGCGSGEPDRSAGNIPAATLIKSTSNAVILKLTMSNRAAGLPQGERGVIRDIGFEGLASAGTSQHCLQLDNRNTNLEHISITRCGGNGLYITDTNNSTFVDVNVAQTHLDGIHVDGTAAVAASQCACGMTFIGGSTVANAGDGIEFEIDGWGSVLLGMRIQANGAYGINMPASGAILTSYVRGINLWDEGNRTAAVNFGGSAVDNSIGYSRFGSPAPVYAGATIRNTVSGAFLSGYGATKTLSGCTAAFPSVCTTTTNHGYASGQLVQLQGTNSTPSLDGLILPITVTGATTFRLPILVTVAATTGTVVPEAQHNTSGIDRITTAYNSSPLEVLDRNNRLTGVMANYFQSLVPDNGSRALPQSGDYRMLNTGTIESRNAAGTADVDLLYLDSDNIVKLGDGDAVAVQVKAPAFIPATGTYGNRPGSPGAGWVYFMTDGAVSGAGDNTCTSGGNGALGIYINGAWRCFNLQN